MRLFKNRSQNTSKRGKTFVAHSVNGWCATFLFLPHFDVIYDLSNN